MLILVLLILSGCNYFSDTFSTDEEGGIQIQIEEGTVKKDTVIPEIDTVLFLRPTESLTLFLQQLGRGLRLSKDKDCLTVLDFVGNSRPEYVFENKFRALIGKTSTTVIKEIEDNF